MPELSGSSRPQDIALSYSLQAPGLVGTVREIEQLPAGETRSDYGLLETGLVSAIEDAGIYAGKIFEIQVEEDRTPSPDATTRADGLEAVTRLGEPAMVLKAPKLDTGLGYAVMYTDEGGVTRFVLPEASAEDDPQISFHLPRQSAPTQVDPRDDSTRGPISKLGRRLVRMLIWETSALLSGPVNEAARRWEVGADGKSGKRPYGFLTYGEDGLAPGVDWSHLQGGRSLLLLHGTFSTAQASYQFSKDVAGRLLQHYQGRVFAFNHPSLHHSPLDNVRAFFDGLPEGTRLEMDIVTHSRGGLVGRTLNELQDQINTQGKQVSVQKAVLVASPNQGTMIAQPEHMLELIDRYTNLITNLPDNAYTLIMEGVLVLVKLLGHAVVTQLPGLNCLPPASEFLKKLQPSQEQIAGYHAIASNYSPDNDALKQRFKKRLQDSAVDKLVDIVFEKAENDMVVPSGGSYTVGMPKTLKIPAGRRKIYGKGIHHCNYFETPAVAGQIAEWLVG